ncbi:MAG: AraC family transcriptional regulator ligand-binding domain-containing protein [Hyphomicrobium sp.]
MPDLPPMISSKALGLMPQFALEVGGDKALGRALADAGLPHKFIEQRDGYIPESALASFVQSVGRQIGQPGLGLLWSPYLTVADYGAWGDYVLSAPSLGQALQRGQNMMPLHSSVDRIEHFVLGASGWYGYRFGLRSHPAYPDIAYSAIGVILSVFRHFLGSLWRPKLVCFDFKHEPIDHLADELLSCPIQWNAERLGVWYDARIRSCSASGPCSKRRVTVEDVIRERAGGPPRDFSEQVRSVLLLQIGQSGDKLDNVALTLDMGPRSIQRRLSDENTSFREISNSARMQRAQELLRLGQDSITSIANFLGYDHSNNFSRAFKMQFGITPRDYQKSLRPAQT